jgi:hypothetical protein
LPKISNLEERLFDDWLEEGSRHDNFLQNLREPLFEGIFGAFDKSELLEGYFHML